ncbi:hypothetical protein MMC21_003264 [Puttea exsequens]|nr:hypothetical protein [Puttea exsequens]
MEHQLLPKGASFRDEDRVTYNGGTDYSLVPFLDYPEHTGYTFLTRAPLSSNFQKLDKESPPADFLVAWIFCGLLQEVLGVTLEQLAGENLYKHEDFVQMLDHPTRAILTTSKLNVLLKQWSDLIQPKISAAAVQYHHLANCLNLAVGPILMNVASRLDRNTNQVLCSTFGIVSHWINHVFNDQGYAQKLKCIAPMTGLFSDRQDLESMIHLGWCPAQAGSLWRSHLDFNVFFYLEKLDRRQDPLRKDRHLNCSKIECCALKAPSKPQHRNPLCDCTEIAIEDENWRKLLQFLESKSIPLLRLTYEGGNVKIEVVRKDSQSRYIALSHVWADGLGNRERNTLHKCQVEYLYRRLRSFQISAQTTDQDLLLWIDTFCCPLEPLSLKIQALALMQQTYNDAEHVLVFDSALENTDHTSLEYLEILARVITSDWMRRLWTLQEGFLAQNLWVQFSRKAISIDQLLIEHNQLDERIEAIMMYRFTRNFIFSIRRRRALKPSSHTFHIHTLAMGVTGRSVTDLSDEPLCLSTILDLSEENAATIARAPPEQRMKILWDHWSESSHGIPSRIIFGDSPKLSDAGYRWAPSTLLRGDVPSVLLPVGFSTGVLCPSGLKVHFPGILLSSISLSSEAPSISKMTIDRPSFIRDDKDLWYTFTVGDLDATNTKVADNPSSFTQELAAAKSPFPPNVKIDYSCYAVIVSGQDGNVVGSTNALLVHLHGKEGKTYLTSHIHSILPPSIVSDSLSTILETAFQFVQSFKEDKIADPSAEETMKHTSTSKTTEAAVQGAVQKYGPLGMGEKALAEHPTLEPLVREFSQNPAASMQSWIELILDGNFVALGRTLPQTQEWCVD